MFKEDYSTGAQILSTGKDLVLNWGNQGVVVENPRVVNVSFKMSDSMPIFVLNERGKTEIKQTPSCEVELELMATAVDFSAKPFKFGDLLKSEMKVTDMMKIIHQQIEDRKE